MVLGAGFLSASLEHDVECAVAAVPLVRAPNGGDCGSMRFLPGLAEPLGCELHESSEILRYRSRAYIDQASSMRARKMAPTGKPDDLHSCCDRRFDPVLAVLDNQAFRRGNSHFPRCILKYIGRGLAARHGVGAEYGSTE